MAAEKATGTVWVVITLHVGTVHKVEFFSERPRTPDVGGDPENWPTYYLVYEGNVDGWDSVLVGRGDGDLQRAI